MGLPAGGGNDFGMSFACDNNLYLTSVATGSLYRMDLAGNATQIGNDGDLGFNISALAAFGNPVKLYGLGNGLDGNLAVDSPNLYEIDIATGIAVEIGPLGPAAGSYSEGGLAFDDSGQLWAITDRRQLNLPSQVMKVDLASGTASEVKSTTEAGFESLAVTVPRGCQTGGNGQIAEFKVQKQFVDENDQTPVTLNIRCFTGVPLEQSLTVLPNDGPFGNFEVKFIVEEFEDGTLNCEVWESAPENYSGSYECFSEGNCEIVDSMCVFDGVNMGQDNLCTIRNYPDPVLITVTSEWLYDSEEYVPEDSVIVDLICRNVFDGDGEPENGSMRWTWTFDNDSPDQVATVHPDWEGSTDCRIETQPGNSAVESTSSCSEWTPILLGDGPLTCTVTNSVFFEGIPTLNQFGLLLLSLLTLFAGTIALRRF